MKKIYYIILLISISASCKKEPAIEYNADLEGRWSSENFLKMDGGAEEHWIIESDSRAKYTYEFGGTNKVSEGNLHMKKGKLKLVGDKYSIDEAPEKQGTIGNVWKMTIEGTTYYSDKDDTGNFWIAANSPDCDVSNSTSDTIDCIVNGSASIIPPGAGIFFGGTFGTTYNYSDNLGNRFTYVAIFSIDYTINS